MKKILWQNIFAKDLSFSAKIHLKFSDNALQWKEKIYGETNVTRIEILDEPLNGLDPAAIAEMRELMRKLTNEGMSILLSSHIIEEVRHTADRIGILSDGYIK